MDRGVKDTNGRGAELPDLTIQIVAGARPNFMKIAPVIKALRSRESRRLTHGMSALLSIVHTGQHYDDGMSEVFFRELGIPAPDRHLGVGSGSHASQTAKIMVAFEKVITRKRPDMVLVVGDVNSTLACSLTAKKLGVQVGHIEAGLRSFDLTMPEEINRKLTDAISDLLFVTEESGVRNLRAEGIAGEKIFLVGNVMIDTLLKNVSKVEEGSFMPSSGVREFLANRKRYAVMTLHRPSNVDREPVFSRIWGAIQKIAERVPVLFPTHPRTRGRMREFGIPPGGVTVIEPIGYLDMLFAVKGATMVLTDSGGLQEETTVLGVPCVTIRENTERPSTVEIGTNYLVGTDPASILSAAEEILEGNAKKGKIPPLWDGHAAERIAEIVMERLMSDRLAGRRVHSD